jgi:hypothetical protein
MEDKSAKLLPMRFAYSCNCYFTVAFIWESFNTTYIAVYFIEVLICMTVQCAVASNGMIVGNSVIIMWCRNKIWNQNHICKTCKLLAMVINVKLYEREVCTFLHMKGCTSNISCIAQDLAIYCSVLWEVLDCILCQVLSHSWIQCCVLLWCCVLYCVLMHCENTIVTCYFCWVCLCLCLGPQLCTGFAAVPWVDSCVLGTVLFSKSCAVPIACLPGYPCSCMCSQLCSMWTALVPYAYRKLCPLSNVVNYSTCVRCFVLKRDLAWNFLTWFRDVFRTFTQPFDM